MEHSFEDTAATHSGGLTIFGKGEIDSSSTSQCI